MSDWKPIETAPKDGTYILIWCPSTGLSLMRAAGAKSETWSGGIKQPEPTHWMPLPPGPVNQEKGHIDG